MYKKLLFITMLLLVCGLGGCKKTVSVNQSEEITIAPTTTAAPEKEETTTEPAKAAEAYGTMRGLSPKELIGEMTAGWNLGNSFDAPGSETAWGNPEVTQEMIDAIAQGGFDILRMPISWNQFTGSAPEYLIDETRLVRIKQVIDYALKNDMYVIINMHHENSWLKPQETGYEAVEEQFVKMWAQIAEYFNGYGDHLLFEGMNEPRVEGGIDEWNGGTGEGRKAVNQLNQKFVDTVRATGGNNAQRCLLITTFAAQPSENGVKELVIPGDKNLIVSIHAYTPYRFTYYNDTSWDLKIWDGSANYEIDQVFRLLDDTFISKGIAVMITEFGAVNKELKQPDQTVIPNEEEIARWISYYVKQANKYNIKCVWWDNGYYSSGNELFGLFNRKDYTWYQPKVLKEFLEAATSSPEAEEVQLSTGFLDEQHRAKAVYGTPNIDGEIDEVWDLAGSIKPGIVIGSGVEAVGEVRLLWDEKKLYLLFQVKDPVLNQASVNDYEQDSVEIFLDEFNDKASAYQEDDLQFRIRYDNVTSFPSGDKKRLTSASKPLTDENGNVTGYLIEAGVEWKKAQKENSVAGFDLQINDASTAGRRAGTITIFDQSGTAWSDPSKMGELILLK